MACSYSPSCLGMCEWTGCPGAAGNSTPAVISAQNELASCSSGTTPTNERFSEFISDQELSELGRGLIPANTTKSTKWALKTFELWKNSRNQSFPDDRVPQELFMSTDPSLLSTHLTRFAVEARKANGEHYPPSSIHQLLCGILRHMREINPHCPNFLDKKDAGFRSLHHALDVQFHKLHSNGIGRQIKHAKVFSKDDELRLWDSGSLGVTLNRCNMLCSIQLGRCCACEVV